MCFERHGKYFKKRELSAQMNTHTRTDTQTMKSVQECSFCIFIHGCVWEAFCVWLGRKLSFISQLFPTLSISIRSHVSRAHDESLERNREGKCEVGLGKVKGERGEMSALAELQRKRCFFFPIFLSRGGARLFLSFCILFGFHEKKTSTHLTN